MYVNGIQRSVQYVNANICYLKLALGEVACTRQLAHCVFANLGQGLGVCVFLKDVRQD